MIDRRITQEQILVFMQQVDGLFLVPLSDKTSLSSLSEKFFLRGTVCVEVQDDRIIAMVAGYTDNVVNNIGYISVVATLPEAQGHGYASELIKEFLEISKEKGLSAVHLYTVKTNNAAVKMYKGLGFVEYKISDEPRPEDLHLIYYMN